MENEEKRSYQREETRRKGCEIHIKKYIDEYSTMWPKFFDVKSHFFFYFYFSPCNNLTRFCSSTILEVIFS